MGLSDSIEKLLVDNPSLYASCKRGSSIRTLSTWQGRWIKQGGSVSFPKCDNGIDLEFESLQILKIFHYLRPAFQFFPYNLHDTRKNLQLAYLENNPNVYFHFACQCLIHK